jgi:hypothetical protein
VIASTIAVRVRSDFILVWTTSNDRAVRCSHLRERMLFQVSNYTMCTTTKINDSQRIMG